MLRETPARRKGKRVRFPHICEDAAKLGVHRIHLWLVLTKRRRSSKLLARYRKIVADRKAALAAGQGVVS